MDAIERNIYKASSYAITQQKEIIGFGPMWAQYDQYSKPLNGNRWHDALIRRYNKIYARSRSEKEYINAIKNAIKNGFRWIDFSCAYGNGDLFGKGLLENGVSRDELIITTRVSNNAQYSGNVREEFFSFLENAKLNYVDILQFHWPVTGYYLDTWCEMEKLYKEGYVKHLGVANCHQHHLEEIYKICKYKPEIGQFEIHPLFTQKSLVKYYQDHDIQVCAYTPVARFDDRLMRLPKLKSIAEKYGKSVIQVVLRWHIQNGVIPIVRAMNLRHQKENIDIFDFDLTQEEIKMIDAININSRLRYDPDNCDFSIL